MVQQKTPRAFNEFFNSQRDFREMQKWYTDFSRTTPAVISEGTPIIITEDTNQNASQAGITINASSNSVTYKLQTPNVYKGKKYFIDVEDDTNGAFVSGILNNVQQDFQIYVEESLIIQDNGVSWRTK